MKTKLLPSLDFTDAVVTVFQNRKMFMENESHKNAVKLLFCVCLLVMSVLQVYGQGTNATPAKGEQSLTTNDNSTDSVNDVTTTFYEIKVGAERGDATDQFNLGLAYLKGDGVSRDAEEAVKWWRKAAEQGFAEAQFNLSYCYLQGIGVPKDEVESFKWCRKAAEQGNTTAQHNLGEMFYNGLGAPQDYAEAVKWFQKGAEQGDANAQNDLGSMCEKGKGVPQDYVEAYKWYNLAAAQGNTIAISNRDSIVNSMTPDQIAEGQKLASEFVPRNETAGTGSDNPASSDNPTASGTGFFITDDGYLITNNHVVKDATKVRLVTSSGTIDAKVVQVDVANDIALLKADGQFESLPILPSRKVRLGDTVVTIGFPDPTLQGFSPKLAKGEIAALAGAGDDARYFQISVPVQPGNSGGALVDERGNVVGIVSAKLDAATALATSGALPENVNYAVKSSYLLSFLESVPSVDGKLEAPSTADEKFSEVAKSAQHAAVLVLVY